jgi:hypothetical protein
MSTEHPTDPAPPADTNTAIPSTNAPETSPMSNDDSTNPAPQFSDPLADPATDPATDPDTTTTIPAASTQALPAAAPFRVEPSTPVPDDAVTDAAQQAHQSDPRPALVTVRKGPRPGSIMFGLLTMIVAGYLLVANLTDADLTFRLVGPPMIGAFGGMLLIVGLAGVVAGKLRR